MRTDEPSGRPSEGTVGPGKWKRLLEGAERPVWREPDYGPILSHQLAAPLRLDLYGLESSLTPWLGLINELEVLGIQNLSELFHHPKPPLQMLRLVKEYAKMNRSKADSPLPSEVAGVLYFLSIAVARVRCGMRISHLSDRQLGEGVAWAQEREWVDPGTKELLREATSQLDPPTVDGG